MRTKDEMLQLILDAARDDDRIRAVVMNGSRLNPNSPPDPFQDFDVVYFVTDVTPFRNNYEWIRRFGQLMIMEEPDDMQDPPPGAGPGFAYLMQFTDGNRIDLGIYPVADLKDRTQDSLSLVLLDKDCVVGSLPPPNEASYLPKAPTRKAFGDCTKEFWWLGPYVAKGLWRQEILYAKFMLDQLMRAQLMKMLVWHIGVQTHFSVNPGKFGRFFEKVLEPDLWQMLERTYSDCGYEASWDALFAMCILFRKVAVPLAVHFGFDYPWDDDRRVSAHLEHVRTLPRDAKEIYP